MKFDIKTDPKVYHHYIIAVAVHAATSGELAGKMYLKYVPIHFTNDDIKEMQYAAIISNDKLFKTTSSEAIKAIGREKLAASISGVCMSAALNQCSLHHFQSNYEMDEKDFETIVNAANISDYFKEKLRSSRIRG
jgi:hypothetical protein